MSGGFGRNESGRWNCRPRSDLSPSTRIHDWGSKDQDGEMREAEEEHKMKEKSVRGADRLGRVGG